VAFDVLLKKYFALLVLVLIGVAAYFQASGIGALTGAALESGAGSSRAPVARDAVAAPGRARAKSAEAILSRNPFDSVTGPLDEHPVHNVPSAAVSSTDPLQAPACPGIHVHIVTEAEDPAWSRAALQRDGDDKADVYRVGDTVGDQKIAYIGYNPRARSPAVWLENGSSLCQALLFADAPRAGAPGGVPPVSSPPPPTPVTIPSAPRPQHKPLSKVDPKLASRIRQLSDTQVRVSPAAVDDILGQPDQLMPSSGVLPESENGNIKGIRIFGIRSNTLLGKLGLESGDRVESVGGVKVTSPDKAIEGYGKMRGAGSLKIQVNRRGHPVTIDLLIR
jgi:general secretion pathway protein C